MSGKNLIEVCRIPLIFIVIISLLFIQKTAAQCIVDLGTDQNLCNGPVTIISNINNAGICTNCNNVPILDNGSVTSLSGFTLGSGLIDLFDPINMGAIPDQSGFALQVSSTSINPVTTFYTHLEPLCPGSTYEVCWHDIDGGANSIAGAGEFEYQVELGGETNTFVTQNFWKKKCLTFVATGAEEHWDVSHLWNPELNLSYNQFLLDEISIKEIAAPSSINKIWTGPNDFTTNAEEIIASVPGIYCLEITDCELCVSNDCIEITNCMSGLGDYTWNDQNKNGIQEAWEPPLEGILIKLYLSSDLDKTNPLDSVVSDSNGYYEFQDLDPELDYFLHFGDLEDYELTLKTGIATDGIGNNSDANPLNGCTEIINLEMDEFDSSIDAGYFLTEFFYVDIDVFLQGPLEIGPAGKLDGDEGSENEIEFSQKAPDGWLMRDDLRVKNLLPTSEPYTADPNITHLNGGESFDPGLLDTIGKNAIMDWIIAEAHLSSDPEVIVGTRAVLVQRDGDVVDMDGHSPVKFKLPPDYYFIAIRHRNHLGVMTSDPYYFGPGFNPTIDFTNPSMETFGNNAQVILGEASAMWSGNANQDQGVVFQGNQNDPNSIFFDVLTAPENSSSQLNYILEGYHASDINLDGEVIYQGINNDPSFIFFNILSHPENTGFSTNYSIHEQLPN